jgi:hypothetical protein
MHPDQYKFHLRTLYPQSPVGLLAHPVQDRKERFEIRSGFHPKDTFGRYIHGASSNSECQWYLFDRE